VSRKKYFFNESSDRLIRDCYDSRTETIDRLSEELGFPRSVIRRRAQILGVARTKERPWSEKEVAYLEANLHRLSLAVLARNLGRSVTAVALKAKRLGIKKKDEGYTARSLAQAFRGRRPQGGTLGGAGVAESLAEELRKTQGYVFHLRPGGEALCRHLSS
jgi:hypothetical protein